MKRRFYIIGLINDVLKKLNYQPGIGNILPAKNKMHGGVFFILNDVLVLVPIDVWDRHFGHKKFLKSDEINPDTKILFLKEDTMDRPSILELSMSDKRLHINS